METHSDKASIYIIGPDNNREVIQWAQELGLRLLGRLEDLPLRTPVSAEELQLRLQPLVEAEVKGSLEDAAERQHLEREQVLLWQLFYSKPGLSGVLSYNYRVDLSPYRVICTSCSGFLTPSGARPEV